MRWVLVTAGKLGGTVAGTDDVAEGVELRGIRPGSESEGAERRLEQQQAGRDKRGRQAPAFAPAVQAICLFKQLLEGYLSWQRQVENRQFDAAATRRDQDFCKDRLSGMEVKSVWRADFRCLRQAASTLPRSRDLSASI